MAFNILDHLDALEHDGGHNDPRGDHSYQCPACGADNFKVNVITGKWQNWNCECSKADIRDAISPARKPDTTGNKPVRIKQSRSWNYFTAKTLQRNQPALTVHRIDDGNGTRKIWQESLVDGHQPAEVKDRCLPYGLPEALQALQDGTPYIFWVEGEPCVDALHALGLFAVTSIGGAGKFKPERDAGHIPPERLVVVPDRDKPGIDHAEAVAAAHPGCKWLFPFPSTPQWNGSMPSAGGLDIADWIQTGATVEHILNGIGSKPVAEPSGVAQGELEELGYTDLLDETIKAIRAADIDREMVVRSELKIRLRISDDRINTDLFKRLGEGKVTKIPQQHGCVDLSRVHQLHYIQDGWVQAGDMGLLYGPYGSGKTTVGLWKAYNGALGKNILDRSQPCTPYKTLIIATDSGLGPLSKAFDDLGIDPETDPLLKPGHPDQMIHVWGYEPEQGHNAWICDIRGVIQLEQYIQQHGIKYVLIDSAKSVSSAAGWSYTSNESVKALLKYIKEAISKPLGCFVEFISHDGTVKGAHSGAKAWAEDPSMVCSLEVKKDEETGLKTVECTFRKDRAAPSGQGLRQFTYYIEDGELKITEDVEVIGNCGEAILEVLWTAHQNGIDSVRTGELIDEVFTRFKKTRKTVENSFPDLMSKGQQRMIRPRRGRYALSPSEIQRRTSPPNRGPYEMGGGISKSLGMTEEIKPPSQSPEGGIGGNTNPPEPPMGETSGGCQNPVTPIELPNPPPKCDGYIGENSNSNLPEWAQPPDPPSADTPEALGF